MKLLLDTHAFLWLVSDDPRLSDTARGLFVDPDNELLLSAATGFEISVKYGLGKLELSEPPAAFIENRIRNNALTPLPISMAHSYRIAELPLIHRDPFDRLLVAQAQVEGLPLLSADCVIAEYDVECLW